jgi:formylglycine-generating enzyme required for sulfatase activity
LAKVVGQSDVEATEGILAGSGDSALTVAGQTLGTPAYMSPEQASGKLGQLGPASDVYSLGATLYCLLTGQAPFPKGDVGVVLAKVQKGEFAPPRQVEPRVPAALEAVCLQAMARSAADRYASARELAEEVERWLADEPVRARREPLPARLARAARKRPALAAGVAALLVTGVIALGVSTLLVGNAQQKTARALHDEEKAREKLQEEQRQRALAQVGRLQDAAAAAVPGILADLEANRDEVIDSLRQRFAAERDRTRRMRLALALLPVEKTLRDDLVGWMLKADDPAEVLLVREALRPGAGLKERLWRQARDANAPPRTRFRALSALAAFDKDNPVWKGSGALAAEQILQANPLHLGLWAEAFRPVRRSLRPTLEAVFRGTRLPESRQAAATVLAGYLADQPEQLAELLLDADDRQFRLLLPLLLDKAASASARLSPELKPGGRATTEAEQERQARRQAAAALALWRLGRPEETWRLWRHTPTPEARSWLVARTATSGVPARQVIDRLGRERDPSARRALILALGEYADKDLPEAEREALVKWLLRWYRNDPDPGIHGAIDWLLRHGREGPHERPLDWGQGKELARIDAELASRARARRAALAAGRVGAAAGGPLPLLSSGEPGRARPGGAPGWYVNGQGMTFTVVPGPVEFVMGSPASEQGRQPHETRHRRRIGRTYALATRAVTVRQWKQFLKERRGWPRDYAPEFSPDQECPINGVSWFMAAAYCNWLSEKEGIPREQWCYPEKIGEGMRMAAGYLKRTGYRLPTEAEWERACRAGAATSRHHGSSQDLLGRYAWFQGNSLERTWPVGQKRPNDLGLFDMHGNVKTWCQDAYDASPTGGFGPTGPRGRIELIKDENSRVLRGGSFLYPAPVVRSANRANDRPAHRSRLVGVRPCRTLP